jgi:hypothetical protein
MLIRFGVCRSKLRSNDMPRPSSHRLLAAFAVSAPWVASQSVPGWLSTPTQDVTGFGVYRSAMYTSPGDTTDLQPDIVRQRLPVAFKRDLSSLNLSFKKAVTLFPSASAPALRIAVHVIRQWAFV